MIGVLTWQAAIGIFICGLVLGWFLSIGIAYRIARRDDSKLWHMILDQQRHHDD